MISAKIKNILVPLDGSKNSIRGLDEAISLAQQFHATITAIYAKHYPTAFVIHPLGFFDINFKKEGKKILASCSIILKIELFFKLYDTISKISFLKIRLDNQSLSINSNVQNMPRVLSKVQGRV